MGKRAAIYARYSTDLQDERSVEDQHALCREYCAREGLTVATCYADHAKSGASILGRDGLISLLAAAKTKTFDVVVVEHSDRLSRSMRDLASIHETLTFQGIEIRAVHSGRLDTATIGLFGLVGQLQREDGAKKVRRGMAGVIREGRHAGGRSYGYRPVPGRRGELTIEEAEAEIVRRIFREYVAGAGTRDIVAALNAEGIPPPRGRWWAPSTLVGNTERGTGILQNQLYAGRIVWNRVRRLKDPETGKRVSRVNSTDDRQVAEAPHLAILAAEVFAEAQAIKSGRGGSRPHNRKPKHMLSGLLKCAGCGGGLAVKDRDHGRVRVMCAVAKDARSCGNRRPYYLDAIERTVVAGLRERLGDRPAVDHYIRTYNTERQRLAADSTRVRERLDTHLASAIAEEKRTLTMMVKGILSEESGVEMLGPTRARIAQLRLELSGLDAPPIVVAVHPRLVEEYLASIDRLEAAIRDGITHGSGEAAKALRALIDKVTVYPPDGGHVEVEVEGRLTSLLGPEAFPNAKLRGGLMVAEEGLEPPTPGL